MREIPHFVHSDKHGVWVMLSTDERPWLVGPTDEWTPHTEPVFRPEYVECDEYGPDCEACPGCPKCDERLAEELAEDRKPRTLRERDYYLSGEHALGTPVLGAEDYWHYGAEMLGQRKSEWQCNLVLLIKATNRVADDLRDAAHQLDSIKLERA